jgi:hypothetical protein
VAELNPPVQRLFKPQSTTYCGTAVIRVHLLFPPWLVLLVFSLWMTRWNSARLRGGAWLLSARLQDGVRFLQHPLPATPTALLAERPALHRRDVRFAMFEPNDTNDLVPASPPAAVDVRVLCFPQSSRLRRPFGWSLSSSLAP